MVGIQGDSEREDESGILPRCWGKCVLTTNRPGWAVTYRLDGRMQEFLFDSLSDAVNHVLAQLQLCLLRGTALDRE